MFTLNDVNTIEQDEDASPLEVCSSLQRAINGGMWSLQGSYGRSMMQAIEAGQCMLGRTSCRDYYGNRIPSRDEVQAGTKGSYEFVARHSGVEWANTIRDL